MPGPGPARILGPLALLAALAGCAHAPRPLPLPEPGRPLPKVAVVSLENLSGRAGAGDALTRLLVVGLVRTQRCDVVEPGLVDRAMEDLRIRPVGTLTRQELQGLRDSLAVDYVLIGTVLENEPVHTPDGEVPSVGLAARLLDARTGQSVWAQMKVRTGEDRETVFGWGRQLDRDRIAMELTTDLLRDFHIPAAPGPAPRTGDKP
jgi:TolB-like protein